jgi:hypothetical protein
VFVILKKGVSTLTTLLIERSRKHPPELYLLQKVVFKEMYLVEVVLK